MITRISLLLLLSTLAAQPSFAGSGMDLFNKASKLIDKQQQLKDSIAEVIENPTEALTQDADLQDAQENNLVAKYPGSLLNAQQNNDLTRAILPLSSNLRSDPKNYKKLQLSGEQSVYLYDVPPEVSKSYFKVFNTLKLNLKAAGFNRLWECDSANKNCGYFFTRQFIFSDRGEDASAIFNKFDNLDNFVDGSSDYAIYTGKTVRQNQSYFVTVIAAQYRAKVQYSIEIMRADDPTPSTEVARAAPANTSEPVTGHTDAFDLVKKFQGANLLAENTNDLTRVTLPLSKNLNDQPDNYKKLKLTGEQQVEIFSVPSNVSKSYLKVLTQLKQNLRSAGFGTLWACDSADKNCGYFFPRRFIFSDRGQDASDIYRKFDGLENFVDGSSDYGIVTSNITYNQQTYYALLIVANTRSGVQYSLEIIKPEAL
jgi:hypothetical protein